MKEPWPDFLTFYAGATGAGWIVPEKYVTKVGEAGFKKAPIGAGPYKCVSFTPGNELVLEAFDQYWRKAPRVKRLVMKVMPDETTRVAALKRGEVDIAYSIRGEAAETVKQTSGLTLKPVVVQGTFCSYPDIDALFPQQAVETDRAKREALLHKMQQMMVERTIFAPIWQLAFINGVGPRVTESAFGLIAGFPYTAPYDDLALKDR